LTVTAEAGITVQALAETLATEGLRLPVDMPNAERATLGGVVATAWSGPRRYGHGTIRDFVIGIRAVDGRGEVFNGGGRVVKNVAGYDFCKLLTGSWGTLGIISQVTLKLRPRAQKTVLLATRLSSVAAAEAPLAALAASAVTPVAVEVVAGAEWEELQPALFVGLEGTLPEVDWMIERLTAEWRESALGSPRVMSGEECDTAWRQLNNFSAGAAPLVLKAGVKPSGVVKLMQALLQLDPQCSLQAHAGNGIVIARFSDFPSQGLSRTLVSQLQPLAATQGGHIVVLSNPAGQESTLQSVFGPLGGQYALMVSVKQQFDPHGILNPGRFVV
jgi:glycolate oxidase FAD binding subunit